MKKILLGLFALILISVVACKKDALSNLESKTESDIYDQSDDPDELIYNEPFELEERASNPLRIATVISNDSLPILATGEATKKQRYYRRQIVSTTQPTFFKIVGSGFGSDATGKNVKAYIAGIEQAEPDILSWSDTLITLNFLPLTHTPAINKTFSIKFKIFAPNSKVGKADFTRSRSRSCISDVQSKTVYSVQVAVKALLEGGLDVNTGLMSDGLRFKNLLPNKEPFEFFVGNPNDSVQASVFAVTGNDAITDWILLEVQTATGTPAYQKACLIQRDGDIVDLDGVSNPILKVSTGYKYHIVIRHRNHRFIKQKTVFKYLATGAVLNFTQDSTKAILTKLKGNYRVMFSGDFNNDGFITDDTSPTSQSTDVGYVRAFNGVQNHYGKSDVDLNGITTSLDVVMVRANIGK